MTKKQDLELQEDAETRGRGDKGIGEDLETGRRGDAEIFHSQSPSLPVPASPRLVPSKSPCLLQVFSPRPQVSKSPRLLPTSAFSLVEVAMALSVAVFCLIPVIGLLPVGLSSNQASIQQTTAASVAARIVADLQSTPSTNGTTTGTSGLGFSIPAAGGTTLANPQILYFTDTANATGQVKAAPVTSGSAQSLYRANVGITPPSAGQNKATMVRVLITWPALAGQNNTGWPTGGTYAGSFETVTALNRN